MSEESIPLTSGLLNALVDFAKYIDGQGFTELPLGDNILSIKEVPPFNIITRVTNRQDIYLIEDMLDAIGRVLSAFVEVYESIGSEWDNSAGLEAGIEKELIYIINVM